MSEPGADAASQSHYQIRFDSGEEGFARLAPSAHAIVWVDALPPVAGVVSVPVPSAAGIPVLLAGLGNRTAVAEWLLNRQVERGDRLAIAIVASGTGAEDALAAGAVIDALTTLGIDFASPEAAVVCAAFTSLRRAATHLFTASVTGQQLTKAGRGDELAAAARLDASTEVVIFTS